MPVHPVTKDLIGDWTITKGNEGAVAMWSWPCPVCGHARDTHCQPYHPNPAEFHSRCSADVPNDPNDPSKGTHLCGTCRIVV